MTVLFAVQRYGENPKQQSMQADFFRMRVIVKNLHRRNSRHSIFRLSLLADWDVTRVSESSEHTMRTSAECDYSRLTRTLGAILKYTPNEKFSMLFDACHV